MRTLLIASLVVGLSAGIPLAAADSLAPAGNAKAAKAANLHDTMEDIEHTYEDLLKQAKDPSKKDSTLKLIAKMQALVLAAKEMPAPVKRVDAANRDKAPAEYRALMVRMMRDLLTAEEQISAGKFDAAAATLEGMKKLQDEGHQLFKVEEH